MNPTLPTTVLATLQEGAAPEEAPSSGLFGGSFLFPMILVIGIFYLVLILPEKKKQKRREAMLSAIKKGDKVMTSSGMYGNVAQIHDDTVVLQVADGVRLRFSRAAVQTVVEPKDEEGVAKADKEG